MIDTLRRYYLLTKPGIIRGNLITAAGGFFLASRGNVNWITLLALLSGTAAIIAAGCVVNNVIDRNIDKKMKRTKNRSLVVGKTSVQSALLYALSLLIAGIAILAIQTNLLTVMVGVTGFIFYVVFYSIWKRRSPIGTLVGSVSGAVPPVAGYTSVTGQLDSAAIILFLILTFWQMPHFYAIALYRSKEYAAANIPVLPLVNGIKATKLQMIAYIVAFIIALASLYAFGHAGVTYVMVMVATGIAWLYFALRGLHVLNTDAWARKVFRYSLLTITLFSLMISIDSFTP